MDISVLGIDLGKNVCSVVGLDASGAVVMRRKVRRETLIALAEKLPPCVVGMEACCGAHHLGRVFAAHGHDVRLMSPEYVRPYVKAQKNDDRDAEGIAEAATRPTMRFVELKSQDQLDMQTLHRSRDRLVGERTALINQLRAILLERGMVAPQGKRKLEQFLAVLMDEQGGAGLSPRMIVLVADARAQWAELDRRIAAFDAEFVRWVKENEEARRLTTIPGVGAIVASALVAAVGQARELRARARSRRVARPGSTSVHDRRQAEAARDQQARQQISAQAADPWSARGAALCGRARHAARPMGESAARVAPIAMSRSSPSPTSWRGSPGRCCGAESGLPPQGCPWRRRGWSVRAQGADRSTRFARG